MTTRQTDVSVQKCYQCGHKFIATEDEKMVDTYICMPCLEELVFAGVIEDDAGLMEVSTGDEDA